MTHKLTHTGKGLERTKEHRAGILPGTTPFSHLDANDRSDGVRRILFHLCRCVSVGV